MTGFDTVKEFIELLYREKKIINILFSRRKETVFYDDLPMLKEDFDYEKFEALFTQEILLKSGNTVELNDRLVEFLEEFTNATEEINNAYTTEQIENLRKYLKY